MSIGAGIWVPIGLGLLLGVLPAIAMWWMAKPASALALATTETEIAVAPVEVALK